MTLGHQEINSGQSTVGILLLSGPAPENGAIVSLESNNFSAMVPETVKILEGHVGANFAVHTVDVEVKRLVTITARYSDVNLTVSLTVLGHHIDVPQ